MKQVTVSQLLDAGISTITETLRAQLNLTPEQETMVEAALRYAADNGWTAAEELIRAMRMRAEEPDDTTV